MANKSERLSKKELAFAQEYAKTGNGTQSALKVYDTNDENMAGVIAYKNIRKDKIMKVVKSIADQIPDSLILQVHTEGLKAIDKDGSNDYAVRHKYLDSAYKVKGLYAAEKHEVVFPKPIMDVD